jgi:hypothetical protein
MPLAIADLILLLAAAQGLFLTILIFHKHGKLFANRFLGAMILIYSAVLVHLFLDELGYSITFPHLPLLIIGDGKAYARGVEITLQKKLAQDIYGMVSGAFFRSHYRDFNGGWRDRIYDDRFLCNIEGGYKPNPKWEFSLRWTYAGGAPHTPFDVAASLAARRGVLDLNRINAERLPAYHSLKLRADRRFHFDESNLILYLDVWNVYGRKNIFSYTWNEVENKQEDFKAWTNSTLPIFGVEYEF